MVRGFVSAADSRTLVNGGFVNVAEGVFAVAGVADRDFRLRSGPHPISIIGSWRLRATT